MQIRAEHVGKIFVRGTQDATRRREANDQSGAFDVLCG
jgi:hypothetical protein